MSDVVNNTSNIVVKIFGLGGCGCTVVDQMISNRLAHVEFICADTDAEALKKTSSRASRLQLEIGGGARLGSGVDTYFGREAALSGSDAIRDAIGNADLLFIVAGMGGSTGTGAAPVVARIAEGLGITTVAVVTTPFLFEGRRTKVAREGLDALAPFVDSLIVVPSEKLTRDLGGDYSISEAFRAVGEAVRVAVTSIVEVISCPGLVGLDLADIRALMVEPGIGTVGYGNASGPERATIATQHAVSSGLLAGSSLATARGILVSIKAGTNLTMKEIHKVMNVIKDVVAEDATVVFGAVFEDDIGDDLRVSILAFGIDETPPIGRPRARPTEAEALRIKAQVDEADRKILRLKEELESSSGVAREKLEQTLAHERSQREAADQKRIEVEKKLALQEAEIARLRTDLTGRVRNSIAALKNSLETTDGNIESNKRWSKVLKLSALVCFLGATVALLWIMAGLLLPGMGMKDSLLETIKELHYLSLIVATFPVLVLLAIGTTLLRHDTKLMHEIRSYTGQKHQIERMAGLLQSAQYAAQDLDKSKDYVEETFTKIRDRLIAMTRNELSGDSDRPKEVGVEEDDSGVVDGLRAFKEVLELLNGSGIPKH